MGKAMGMLKELGGRLTGDIVLEREGRAERHGAVVHHDHSVGGRVREVLDEPFDERHPAHGDQGSVAAGSATGSATIAPMAPPVDDAVETVGSPDDAVIGDEDRPLL